MNQDQILAQIKQLKDTRFGEVVIPCSLNATAYQLVLLTRDCEMDVGMMTLLGKWRKDNESWFQAIFPVSLERTTRWFQSGVIGAPDRLLFMIKVGDNFIGHVGLFRFNFANNSCEIDNIVRGEKGFPGIMGSAILQMMAWGKETLGLSTYTLETTSDNERALKLYAQLNFVEVRREPLFLNPSADHVEWIPVPAGYTGEIKRYNVFMEFSHD